MLFPRDKVAHDAHSCDGQRIGELCGYVVHVVALRSGGSHDCGVRNWRAVVAEYRASQSWFEEQIQVPFETIELPIPKEYDKVLRAQYGDYMTPVRGGADHDYPFYRKQQEMVDARNNRCL